MVDNVENILREIAERVRAEQSAMRSSETATEAVTTPGAARTLSPLPTTSDGQIDSYLTTTARAWDRLPPVVSNRTGSAARLELMVKRFLKRVTRWYTWEQVNFNAAAHGALKETSTTLADLASQLREGLEAKFQATRAEIAQLADLAIQLREDLETKVQATRTEIDALASRLETQQKYLQVQEDHLKDQAEQLAALTSRLLDITNEVRERSDAVLTEQRVSFKQLLLEISELATLVDRSKRQLQTRLDKLEAPLEK